MTEYRLIIQPVAANDITEARDWYESQRDGLGGEFLDEIHDALRRLEKRPTVHRLIYHEYRQVVIRRFPYVIHYHVEDDRVSVVGIFHGHRDPQVWQDRIDNLFGMDE